MSNYENHENKSCVEFLISSQTISLLLYALDKKWTISLLFESTVRLFMSSSVPDHTVELRKTLKTKKSIIKSPTLLRELKPHQIFITYF